MEINMYQLLTIMLLTTGLGLLLTGLFTAYFGRGKSRMVGIVLAVVGVVVGLLMWQMHAMGISEFQSGYEFMELIWSSIKIIGAFVIGAIIALAIFLVAIMKT